MTQASIEFLTFALVGAALFHSVPRGLPRKWIFLALNVGFITTTSPGVLALGPVAGFLMLGFASLRLMTRGLTWVFWPAILTIVAAFIWLKQYTFIPKTTFLSFPYVTLGLSYICFRIVHMLVDSRQGVLPRLTLLHYCNYTINFLTLVSGPLQRYGEFVEQMDRGRNTPWSTTQADAAIARIAVGMFKVLLLSPVFLQLHTHAIADFLSTHSYFARQATGVLLLGSYPLFLYSNFSGYIDVGIGLAKFFDLQLPENFDRPFASSNFLTFWNRWHMTLSKFFKTYVFNPLLLAMMIRMPHPRTQPYLGVIAFFATFLLLGIWHGQSSIFLSYGLALGLGVSANKLYQIFVLRAFGSDRAAHLSRRPAYIAACRGATFTYFAFSLVFFWSNWGQLNALRSSIDTPGFISVWIALGICSAFALWIVDVASVKLHAYVDGALCWITPVRRRVAVAALTVFSILAVHSPAGWVVPENIYRGF
jgi:alginate O-acetyltransferase complex protein AlgI